jgi:hypothetical protein
LERFGGLTVEDEDSLMEKPGQSSVEVAVEIEWPVPWCTGAPMPLILAADRVFLIYYATEVVPNHNKSTVKVFDEIKSRHPVALVEFLRCYDLRFGGPNDEVYKGQPLYGRGLESYAAHVVENSNWLRQVEEINKVHPGYDPDDWRRFKHYLLLFHDEQFECLARSYYIEVYDREFDEVVETAMNRIIGRDKWFKDMGT